MKITGPIRQFDIKNKVFSVLVQNKVYYFYLQRNLMKNFSKYLFEERYVTFVAGEDYKTIQNTKCYRVDHFLKIYKQRHRKRNIYYDIREVKSGIVEIMDLKQNRMFLDLELSMHPYYKTKTFVQEIIQAGIVIENDEGVLESHCDFIRPTLFPNVTERTTKFLKIKQEDVDAGLSAIEFQKKLKSLVDQYDPKIYVWGRNDYLALRDFSRLNKFRNPTPRNRFVNLLQLYKTYHNLKNDVGLFKCYESFGFDLPEQRHNALEDAEITRLVFHAFKKETKRR